MGNDTSEQTIDATNNEVIDEEPMLFQQTDTYKTDKFKSKYECSLCLNGINNKHNCHKWYVE